MWKAYPRWVKQRLARMHRPAYRINFRVLPSRTNQRGDLLEFQLLVAVISERDASEIPAKQEDARRSTRGHGRPGRCEIHEESGEKSEFCRQPSLRLQSRNRPGLRNQNKYASPL